VFSFRLMVFQIVQKYMSASISVAAETGVVAIGPIANLCVFVTFVGLGLLFHKVRLKCVLVLLRCLRVSVREEPPLSFRAANCAAPPSSTAS
jgi:hypothetical protein